MPTSSRERTHPVDRGATGPDPVGGSAPDADAVRLRVEAEQVALLYAHTPGGLTVTVLVAVLLCAMLWEITPSVHLLGWLAAVSTVVSIRAGVAWAYRNARARTPGPWGRAFVLGSTLQALLWGFAGVALFPSHSTVHQLFLMVVLCGMASGAVVYLSPVRMAYVLYLIPTLLPISSVLLLKGSPVYVSTGLTGVVYAAAMLYAAQRTHESLASALELGFEKEALAEGLSRARDHAEETSRRYEGEIRERRRAQQAFSESQERYRTLLDVSPDPILVVDAEGRGNYANLAFEETFGWLPRDLQEGTTAFVPADRTTEAEEFFRRASRGEGGALETSRRASDGRVLDVQLKAAALRDPAGRVEGHIAVYRDVSERKRVEQELERYRDHLEQLVEERTRALRETNEKLRHEIEERRQAQRELTRSELKYRHLVEELNDVIFSADPQGVVSYVSPAVEGIIGYAPSEVVGRPLGEFVHPKDLGRVKRALKRAVRGDPTPIEVRVLTRGGEVRWVRSSGRTLVEGGQVAGIQGVVVDLTDVKRAEEERRSLQTQLLRSQRMEAVGTLAGGIAHDFRNLMQVIQGYAELLLLILEPGQRGREELHRIITATDRGSELTSRLLTFSRQTERNLGPVDLNEVVRDVEKIIRRTFPRTVEIRTRLEEPAARLQGDASQLEQVLMNLVLNAKDAMPGGGRLTIETLRVAAPRPDEAGAGGGGEILLRVTDTGQGIEPGTLDHIFDPFFTTKGVGEGSGLGLSIAYGVVEGHGGRIECRSEAGRGTVFEVLLPAFEGLPSGPPAAALAGAPAEGRGERVLVVDDEEEILGVAREFLEDRGYVVSCARSGEEALEQYAKSRGALDLVVLDLGMPGMGGRRCLEELLSLEPGLRVLVASGYDEGAQTKGPAERGAVGFIPKPYHLEDLGRAVRLALDNDPEAAALRAPGG